MGTSTYLTRQDETRNMARFYAMSLQVNLFAEYSLVREWGRIGRGGQVREDTYATADDAHRAFLNIQQAKLKRGYVAHGGQDRPALP